MPAPALVNDALDGVRELRRVVCGAAASFDSSNLDGAAASAAVTEWAAIAHAADAAMALAAARLSACALPPSAGARDAAELVAMTTGVTASKAKGAITRGLGLAGHEQTRAAATAGRLSPEQAGAVTDAVAVNPEAEQDLLDEATRSSLGELRLTAASRKAERQDLEQIEARIHAHRRIRRWRDPEGAEHLHATGTRRDLALIDQALKGLIDERFRQARAAGAREPFDAYHFDALVDMARRVIDGTRDDTAAGTGAGKRRDPIRHLAILRVDLPVLTRGHLDGGETCEIAGLGPVSVATAREILTEAVLKLVLTTGVEVRNVTHLGRGPTTAQKIALLWEQPVCTRKGCGRRARLEYDHIDGHEYRLTHHTRIDELAPLCEPDHDLKTRHGWALVEGTGIRPLVPPDDPRHPRHQRTRAS